MPDYYKTLGLGRGATKEEIRRAYKELAVKCHPDKNPQNKEEATKKFQELKKAYEVLIENTKDDKGVSDKRGFESFTREFYDTYDSTTEESDGTDEFSFGQKLYDAAKKLFDSSQSYEPSPFAYPHNFTGRGVPKFSRSYNDSGNMRNPRPTSTTSFQYTSSAGTSANGRPFYEEREESIVNGNLEEEVVKVVNGQRIVTIKVNGLIREQYVFPDHGPEYRAQNHTSGYCYSSRLRPNSRHGGYKTDYKTE